MENVWWKDLLRIVFIVTQVGKDYSAQKSKLQYIVRVEVHVFLFVSMWYSMQKQVYYVHEQMVLYNYVLL